MRREYTHSWSRASSTSNSSSATPFQMGMAGWEGSGTRYCCRGGARYWPGCPSSRRLGGGRRTITRPWPAPARPARARTSSSSCSKQSGKPYFPMRGQRMQRTRSASVRLLSWVIIRAPPSLNSRNISAARSEALSASSRSSRKKVSSNDRGVPGRACGLSASLAPKSAISRPRIGVETPLLHNEPLLLRREGNRR